MGHTESLPCGAIWGDAAEEKAIEVKFPRDSGDKAFKNIFINANKKSSGVDDLGLFSQAKEIK